MGYDASDFLRADHREVENHLDSLLHALKHLSPDQVSEISRSYREIHRLVSTHMEEEERVFYPAVQTFAEDLLPHMLKQHEEMRETDRYLGSCLRSFRSSQRFVTWRSCTGWESSSTTPSRFISWTKKSNC